MRLALFGGSFDPPHIGHEAIAKEAISKLDIDRLIVMPTFINPFKDSYFANPNLRLEWLKKLFGNLEKVEVCDYEISQNRPVPTIESVKFIYKKYIPNKIYLIIGADNLASLKTWDSYDELERLVEFVVASREGIEIPYHLQKLYINANISSTKFRNNLNLNYIPTLIQNDVEKVYKRIKMVNLQEKTDLIVKALEDKKAEDVEAIDMDGKDYIAKKVIIATTLVGKHAMTLSDEIASTLKPFGEKFLHIESSDEWTVIDLGDIIIHLMSDDYRAKYDIEDFLEKLKFISKEA